MDRLPLEIVDNVLCRCSRDVLANLCFVSQSLARLARRHLFDNVLVNRSKSSVENLSRIAERYPIDRIILIINEPGEPHPRTRAKILKWYKERKRKGSIELYALYKKHYEELDTGFLLAVLRLIKLKELILREVSPSEKTLHRHLLMFSSRYAKEMVDEVLNSVKVPSLRVELFENCPVGYRLGRTVDFRCNVQRLYLRVSMSPALLLMLRGSFQELYLDAGSDEVYDLQLDVKVLHLRTTIKRLPTVSRLTMKRVGWPRPLEVFREISLMRLEDVVIEDIHPTDQIPEGLPYVRAQAYLMQGLNEEQKGWLLRGGPEPEFVLEQIHPPACYPPYGRLDQVADDCQAWEAEERWRRPRVEYCE